MAYILEVKFTFLIETLTRESKVSSAEDFDVGNSFCIISIFHQMGMSYYCTHVFS